MRWASMVLGLRRLTLLAAAVAMLSCVPARASTVVYLTATNPDLGLPEPGNYGSVTLDDKSTDNSLAVGTVRLVLAINPARTGDKFKSFGFNSNASLSGATISVTEVPNTAVWTSGGPPWNQDGFGNFDAIVSGNGSANEVSSATILVSGLSVANATITNFLKLSSGNTGEGNVYFAAHLAPGGGGATGYVGAPSLSPVPEPSSFALGLGAIGLLGVAGLRRRRTA